LPAASGYQDASVSSSAVDRIAACRGISIPQVAGRSPASLGSNPAIGLKPEADPMHLC
jgi:hypothetical protein